MPKSLSFYKMQGAGNDFVVWDNRTLQWSVSEIANVTPRICERHFGIGADGVLVLSEAEVEHTDYQMIFRNPDGSDAGMCGNGGRCIAKYAHQLLGYPANHSFHVHHNVYQAHVYEGQVSLDFPMAPSIQRHSDVEGLPFFEIHPGTEHFVLFVSEDQFKDPDTLLPIARRLRYDKKRAPRGANVNFALLTDNGTILLKTYERGVEKFTLACGTGAIATALATFAYRNGMNQNSGKNTLKVKPEGGPLEVAFTPHTVQSGALEHFSDISLQGPAEFVFAGEIQL